MVDAIPQERLEALGPAERIINSLTQYLDHMVHNRPGMVSPDARTKIGVKWEPVTWKQEKEDDEKIVYRLSKVGRKTMKTRIGTLREDGKIVNDNGVIGEYRKPGLFPEVAGFMYKQVADVWKADNEFSARWASWTFPKDHRDMKVILAAFMLCQDRAGLPVIGADGKPEFEDDDFRAVGEAMCLLPGKHDFNPKLLNRIGDVLALPQVAEINRELGFGKSAKRAFLGRYPKAVEKWLRYREENPKLLHGLVRAGFRTSVMRLAQRIGYKPTSPFFFETLRWKQTQAKDGRRTIAIGAEVKKADTWDGLSEKAICQRIMRDRPNWKQIVGKLPAEPGLTCAIVAAAIQAKCLSNADLIILTPTLEEMNLLDVPEIAACHKAALEAADNQRAANIARRVKKAETAEKLQNAADGATAKAMEEVTRGLRIYMVVDKSGSMYTSLAKAKQYLTKFLGAFPLDRVHVSVFNTIGMELKLKSGSAAGVEQAFRGHGPGGGTCHAQGVEVLISKYKPEDDEDALVIFVGDEGEWNNNRLQHTFERHGVKPVAFGLLKVAGQNGEIVTWTAAQMGIPCFPIEEELFNTDDPYAVTRTFRNLIANTPVGQTQVAVPRKPRKPLLQEILETELLEKPLAFQ